MKKILAVFAALFLMGAMATPAMAGEDVTFCHDTNGPNQVEITTDIHGWQNGHEKHIGTNVQGHDNDRLGPCPPAPTPTPTETPTTPPPAGPPAPAKDFCDNLEGVQWENYDCNTPQVVEVVPTPEATPEATPTPTEPPVVSLPVPDKPTVPKAIPAGEGSDSGFNWLALVLIAGAAVAGAFALRRLNN
jgi:hypothetical protein